ncbi:DUF6230 family protein [Halocatena salina]|uniref:DUF6230 family protein n=1 Tax=Halocatena salina TaxID=2934340 RepID=A0A8U0A356_9EURY|nr:DUF6230 family protein [Halocatena salina]UPM43610.1 DUF6230 family protein [Halocatena salina]
MYNKRTFGKGMGVSIVVLAVIAVLVISTGSAYAVPLAGIGGFTIQADQLTAESAYIYPGVDDTSNQDAYPMAVIEQKDVKIDGMKLMKSLDVDAVPGLSGSARVVMTSSDTVTADQQMVKVSNIEADTAEFNQQVIDESNSNNPSDQFGIWSGDASQNQDKLQNGKIVDISDDGPAQKLEGANIKAHYLASSSISIPGLSLEVQYDEDGDGQYNE